MTLETIGLPYRKADPEGEPDLSSTSLAGQILQLPLENFVIRVI